MSFQSAHMILKALLVAGLSLFGSCLAAEEPAAPDARRPAPQLSPSPMPPSVKPEELQAAETRIQERLKQEAEALQERIRLLGKDTDEQSRQLQKLFDGDRVLAGELEGFQKKLDSALKKLDDSTEDIEAKGARMQGLLDIVNTLKRDVNDNAHEIAEMKADLEKLRKASSVSKDDPEWWQQLLEWKYLPAAAAVLSGAALAITLTRK